MFDTWYGYGLAKKDYVTDLIDQYGPYRFMVTLSFQHLLTDEKGVSLADIYWRRTTKKIFEAKEGREPVTSITGCCVLEKARITGNLSHDKNCHFHFLVKDHPIFAVNEDVAIAQLKTASWKAVRNFKTSSGSALVSEEDKGVHVQSVYSSDVDGYLSKEAWRYTWKREDNLFFMDKSGLVAASPAAVHEMFR